VPCGYVKDFVCDMPQKSGYLGCGDLPPLARGGVLVHCHEAVTGCAKVVHSPNDVEAG
jgi:hypothetical protein